MRDAFDRAPQTFGEFPHSTCALSGPGPLAGNMAKGRADRASGAVPVCIRVLSAINTPFKRGLEERGPSARFTFSANMNSAKSNKGHLGRIAGGALAHYIEFVRRTSSVTFDPADLYDRMAAEAPAIVALWHGQFLLVPALQRRDFKAQAMVARHGDAEVIAEVLRRFDCELIRGAGAGNRRADKGGAQALRAALRTLASGSSVVMTADVPPGPARVAGLGIVTLAQLSGRPILPVAVASSRFMAFDTWSRMTINLPFARIGAVLGQPIHVARTATADDLERARQAVGVALDQATDRAYVLAGGDRRRATPATVLAREEGAPEPGAGLATYRALTRVAGPMLPVLLAYRRFKGKEDAARADERLGRTTRTRPDGTLAWFHAASVGETNAILPVIAAMQARRPDLRVLLTTGTVTSARIAADRLGPRAFHQYVPLDAPEHVRRFLDHWRPDIGVLTESDIWPNLILESASRDIPLALVNARMSTRSFSRWRKMRGISRPLFGRFAVVLAQNERLARRFGDLGAIAAQAVGNLKIDAPPPPINAAALAALRAAIGARPCYVAASTHPGEEDMLAAAHRQIAARVPGVLTIIAPRHPDRGAALAQQLSGLGFAVSRRSQGALPDAQTEIYLADTLNELGTLFAVSPIAFMGGSLVPHGGQNPIEAVRHDAVVLTGPHTANFTDFYPALVKRGGALVVQDSAELADAVSRLLTDGAELATRRAAAQQALTGLAGALDRTVEALLGLLPAPEGLRRAS